MVNEVFFGFAKLLLGGRNVAAAAALMLFHGVAATVAAPLDLTALYFPAQIEEDERRQ